MPKFLRPCFLYFAACAWRSISEKLFAEKDESLPKMDPEERSEERGGLSEEV